MNTFREIQKFETNTHIYVCHSLPAVFLAACGLKMRNGCFVQSQYFCRLTSGVVTKK